METRTCIGPECKEQAARGDLCWGHLKQRERGQVLRPIAKLTPEERVIEAGSAFLEAEDEDEYRATRARFLRMCELMVLSQGWRPPARKLSVVRSMMEEEQLGLGFEARARRRSAKR
jgi:hypothetical protein